MFQSQDEIHLWCDTCWPNNDALDTHTGIGGIQTERDEQSAL